jgi:hypothetical protein
MDIVEPKRVMPYVDNEDPNRANILNEQPEPTVMKSSTETQEPILATPYNERDEPTRAMDLKENALPRVR